MLGGRFQLCERPLLAGSRRGFFPNRWEPEQPDRLTGKHGRNCSSKKNGLAFGIRLLKKSRRSQASKAIIVSRKARLKTDFKLFRYCPRAQVSWLTPVWALLGHSRPVNAKWRPRFYGSSVLDLLGQTLPSPSGL
jgi:hypothetical protein